MYRKNILLATLDTAYGVEINAAKTTDYTFTAGMLSINLPDLKDGGSVTVTFQVVQI